MRIKLFLLFLLFIFIFPSIYSQENDKKSINIPQNQIKLSPFRLIDFVNPGLELSYERIYFKNNLSTQISVAYINDLLNLKIYDKIEGYRIALEEKYFFLKSKKVLLYTSANLVYYKSKIDTYDMFHYKPNHNNETKFKYDDYFTVNKQTFTTNVMFGCQILLSPIILEFNLGMGIKYKIISHSDRLFPEDEPNYNFIDYHAMREGKRIAFNFPANFKIGFIF